MPIEKKDLQEQIHSASKQTHADYVIKNAKTLDVFNLDWFEEDIAITNGKIVGIGNYSGKETLDAKGRYLCPSFIDGHVHIESSMVPPAEFAKVVMPHGVTSVITDPHEIANVAGTAGIQYMIEDAIRTPMDIFLMLPSCVPATPSENAGAVLNAEDLNPFLENERVLGLAEIMDYPSLRDGKDDMIEKVLNTLRNGGKIDGHLAGLPEDAINLYRTAGVDTDHECHTAADALERLRRGMYVLLREGSAAKDLNSLLPVVNYTNARRCLFCTDDKHLDDITEEGSIDHNIRLAIEAGLPIELAYQMGSLNAAECYGLNNKGAIAPGYDADFLLLDSLEDVKIAEVYKSGKLVAQHGSYTAQTKKKQLPDETITSSVNLSALTIEDLQIPIGEKEQAHIIEINPNQIVTNQVIETVDRVNGNFRPSLDKDQLKIAVVERHKRTGNIGSGIVKGFGIKDGAIATTIAHDSHNIVAAGTNDEDLLLAIHTLEEIQGGLVIVQNGKVTASLALKIAGLMSEDDHTVVCEKLKSIDEAIDQLGFKGDFNPFLTLSFLTLPVIPKLKLTDTGLFDVEHFKHIEVSL